PGRTAGRYHQDRAGGGRDDAADPFVARLELLRRMKKEEERVVRQGRLESLIGGLVAVAQRLQAHPPSLVARRAPLAPEMLDEFKRAEQAGDSQLLLSHHLSPHEESGRPHPPLYFTGQGQQTFQQTVSHMAAHTSGKVSSRAIASSDKRKLNFRRGRTLSG